MPVSKNRGKKRKRKKKPPVSGGRTRSGEGDSPPPIEYESMERTIGKIQGGLMSGEQTGGDQDPLRRAQELIYDAWEIETRSKRIKLARQALEISDLCADAYSLLADDDASTLVETRECYEQAVSAGERAIGPQAFEQDVGRFWGLLDTRPYMRARAGLAESLWQTGERIAAIGHVQDMLRLNPNDNQGLRYTLTSWLLAVRDHGALEILLADYRGDGSANWTYTETLLAFRKGNDVRLRRSLKAAWRSNHSVAPMLIGSVPPLEYVPEMYSPGSPEEAFLYVIDNRENWASTEGALPWLAKAMKGLPSPKRHGRFKR